MNNHENNILKRDKNNNASSVDINNKIENNNHTIIIDDDEENEVINLIDEVNVRNSCLLSYNLKPPWVSLLKFFGQRKGRVSLESYF